MLQLHIGMHIIMQQLPLVNVTVFVKTIFNGTFAIGVMRNTDLKYLNCCGSVVLDCSHTGFTAELE